jgi:hypothetical protein
LGGTFADDTAGNYRDTGGIVTRTPRPLPDVLRYDARPRGRDGRVKVLIGFLKFVSYFSLWGVAICGLYFLRAVFPFTLPSVINAVIYAALLYALHRLAEWMLSRLAPKAAS